MVMSEQQKPAITLSGPLTQRAQARKILQGKGFDFAEEDNPSGLPDNTLGEIDKSVGFLTVIGDDPDFVLEVLHGLDWQVRAHWQGVIKTSPLLDELRDERVTLHDQQIDELQREIARMKGQG